MTRDFEVEGKVLDWLIDNYPGGWTVYTDADKHLIRITGGTGEEDWTELEKLFKDWIIEREML